MRVHPIYLRHFDLRCVGLRGVSLSPPSCPGGLKGFMLALELSHSRTPAHWFKSLQVLACVYWLLGRRDGQRMLA